MTASPSAETWRRAIRQAHAGDARHLLELLLLPAQTDGRGNALPGAFYDLPDDGELRLAIVRALVFGPWKGATTIGELLTKTGWGKGKPALSDLEVGFAAVFERLSGGEVSVDKMAEAYGIEPETLRKRIAKHRKRK